MPFENDVTASRSGFRLLLALREALERKLIPQRASANPRAPVLDEFAELAAAEAASLQRAAAKGRFSAALACMDRNRYSNVLPLNETRVRLRRMPVESGRDGDGGGLTRRSSSQLGSDPLYVNASRLEAAQTGDVAWRLVATQGPLRGTREHFWQMTVEARAAHVVMLCQVVEGGVAKSAPCLPAEPGWKKTYGAMNVKTLVAETVMPGLSCRSVLIRDLHAATRSSDGIAVCADEAAGSFLPQHQLLFWQYTEWPDHGVPRSANALTVLVDRLVDVQEPIVVHCSAGIGRTGVFVLLLVAARRVLRALRRCADDDAAMPNSVADDDAAMPHCAGDNMTTMSRCPKAMSKLPPLDESHPPDFSALAESLADLGALLRDVRMQRPGCVQTPEQYAFAHRALAAWVRGKLDAWPEQERVA